MNELTTEATKNGWNQIQFDADVIKRTQLTLFEYDQQEVARLLRSIANYRLYDAIDNQPLENDQTDPEYALSFIRDFLLHDLSDKLPDEIVLNYYALIKKYSETHFPNQIDVASFAYPYFCSISFTNQYRASIKEQMEEMTGINDLLDLDLRDKYNGRVYRLYHGIQFRPVGVGTIFKIDNPLFYFYEKENGICYTYMQSSILTHYQLQPCNTFFWVRCFSRVDKSKEIKLWDDFEVGELVFEILDHNPDHFPKEYSLLPYKIRSSFKRYRSSLYKSYLWDYEQRLFLKEAICNPVLWIDNLVKYKEAVDKYNQTGSF